MRIRSLLASSLSIAAVGAALWCAPLLSAQTNDSTEISALLAQAKTHAALAADDAATLQSYVSSNVSWQTHSSSLNQMKEHVNSLGRLHKQLVDLRPQGSPWQQVAIDRVDPLLRDVAAQLTATIKHLNENPGQVHMAPYRDYVEATYEYDSRTAELIHDFVDYDTAKAKVEALEAKLELPPRGE